MPLFCSLARLPSFHLGNLLASLLTARHHFIPSPPSFPSPVFSCPSDHIALLSAFNQWQAAKQQRNERDFCWQNFLSAPTMQMISDMRGQFVDLLSDIGFYSPQQGMQVSRVRTSNVEGIQVSMIRTSNVEGMQVSRIQTSNVEGMQVSRIRTSNVEGMQVSRIRTSNVEGMQESRIRTSNVEESSRDCLLHTFGTRTRELRHKEVVF